MATAKTHRICAFGARIQLTPDMELGEIDERMREFEDMVRDMSDAGP